MSISHLHQKITICDLLFFYNHVYGIKYLKSIFLWFVFFHLYLFCYLLYSEFGFIFELVTTVLYFFLIDDFRKVQPDNFSFFNKNAKRFFILGFIYIHLFQITDYIQYTYLITFLMSIWCLSYFSHVRGFMKRKINWYKYLYQNLIPFEKMESNPLLNESLLNALCYFNCDFSDKKWFKDFPLTKLYDEYVYNHMKSFPLDRIYLVKEYFKKSIILQQSDTWRSILLLCPEDPQKQWELYSSHAKLLTSIDIDFKDLQLY